MNTVLYYFLSINSCKLKYQRICEILKLLRHIAKLPSRKVIPIYMSTSHIRLFFFFSIYCKKYRLFRHHWNLVMPYHLCTLTYSLPNTQTKLSSWKAIHQKANQKKIYVGLPNISKKIYINKHSIYWYKALQLKSVVTENKSKQKRNLRFKQQKLK